VKAAFLGSVINALENTVKPNKRERYPDALLVLYFAPIFFGFDESVIADGIVAV
jgi:hypothetical protein